MHRLTVAAAVLALWLVIPAGAFANAGQSNRTPETSTILGVHMTGWIGTTQGGKNHMTTQFRASYTDGLSGPVTCSGVNHTAKNIASPNGRDSFTCTSTIGGLTFTPFLGQTGGWWSDFWALQDQAVRGTFTVTDTDGQTYWTAVATY